MTSTDTAAAPARLVVFGAWYISHAVAEAAELSGWAVAGFVDPEPPERFATLRSVPDDVAVIAAIGNNRLRAMVCGRLIECGRRLVSIVHPSAIVSRSASVGPGCYLAENAVVRANATVGRGVFLNAGAIVSHDCRIGDFVTFGPTAATASHVAVGRETTLGVGVSVRPRARIGRDCVVGAGAAVVEDIGDGLTAVGVPARGTARSPDAGKQSDWGANRVW